MTGIELFIWILLVIGWVLFQAVRKILKPPRSLGKIEDEAPVEGQQPSGPPWPLPSPVPAPRRAPAAAREAPLDVEWGRTPEPPPPLRPPPPPRVTPAPRLPTPIADEPFAWSADRASSELALAREMGRRQAERRRAVARAAPRRHPDRPRLQTHADLRKAVVVAAVLGPCRAFDPYRSPDAQP